MIGVIGGGPVGSYLAYLLAGKKQVHVFEEHGSIGLPVQCTGLITSALDELVKVRKSFLVNTISRARIFSPNGNFIEVKLRKKNYVVDRMKFDRHLAEMAKDKGAIFHMNHKFTDFKKKNGNLNLEFQGKRDYAVKKLVGADGPMSPVAKAAGIFNKRKFIIGLQARVSSYFEKDLINFYLDRRGFGWIVPESERIARVGIVTYDNPNQYFKDLLKKIGKHKIREYHSGVIPLYDRKVISQKGNVFLVGDSATQVKATTFGGVIPGLFCAKELSKAILQNKSYPRLWKKKVGIDLWMGLLIRQKLDKFSNKKYDELVRLFNKKSLKKILESNDRDFPSKFLFKLLVKEPKLLKFI